MTKAELITRWKALSATRSHTHSLAECEAALDVLCDIITGELHSGGEVTLPHLGKLKIAHKAARMGRNPRTGEAVDIPAGRKVVFVAGKELKEALK